MFVYAVVNYRPNVDESSAAPSAADAFGQFAEQAQVERLYSLHDEAAKSAATAAALMNMPGCDHHVASAVVVAELCGNPAGREALFSGFLCVVVQAFGVC